MKIIRAFQRGGGGQMGQFAPRPQFRRGAQIYKIKKNYNNLERFFDINNGMRKNFQTLI
jgi:hypothetical protein